MTQLLFIETFALGAAAIAAIYHLVLFIQQRDKFLVYYSAYLFTLTAYIVFKLISNNYDPFQPTDNIWYYIFEEVIQVTMVAVYVLFAAQTLEVVKTKSIVRTLMYLFFVLSALSICYHIFGAIVNGAGVKSVQAYAVSRISLVSIATLALLFAWRIRNTVFQRTIIIGSLVYDCSGLLSIVSFTQHSSVFGLSGVEPYLVGCLLDIIIFSSAFGYRLKTIAEEKNRLIKRENDARMAIEKTRMRITINLHDEVGSVLSSMSIYGEAAKKS
ncbi:MAG: 7TM diverse intracellular signaling domain-containing protein, partial [Bacteroidia bacterium]